MRTEFRVPCTTGTYADTLTALGLAKLLTVLGATEVRIQRPPNASYYLVSSKTPIPNATNAPFQYLFPGIVTKGKSITSAADIDYEAEKAKRTRYFEWRKANPRVRPETLAEGVAPEPPRRDYSLISSLVDMLKPIENSSYTKTAEVLAHQFGLYAEAALEGFATLDGEPERIEARLKQLAGKAKIEVRTSAVQIFNPMAGKGMNAGKPNSIGMGGLEVPIPVEMLKFSGWWHGAVAATPRKTKDLKVLVIAPKDIGYALLESVVSAFREVFYGGGAIQIDVMAALCLTEVLLQNHEAVPSRRGRPRHVIAGLNSAYFQSLGNAKGVSNLSFISLPEWIEVQDDSDRQLWLEVIGEHRRILSRLDESRSEAHNLLQLYRDFLSLGLLEHFLEFLVDYGAYALGVADRNKPVQWFTTNLLRRVFMGLDNETGSLSEILDNPGFQSIAAAIRRSTRGALYAKKLSNDRTYEVRYGLAQELKRKALYKSEFAAALANFITEYMTENLRAADRGKRQRPAVTTTDLEQVIALMDKHNPETVAMLLIAYGYAKEPRDADEPVVDDLSLDVASESEGEE
ncbi:hypothetical protein [Meiothermus sp.]|uniref:hypothetical protein n=1 Tax=Meiothermus sp. TaxID=1955249 RepID=UPI0021DBC70F|nr:hypothetical protein [Meiothermus sp.]GIW26185.1 MAG: hypothetical protein KatS3mg069_2452 [Meiothermus sp.]